uniref:Transmembrane 9 superfamily member 7-like n=1 Tax=Tanacetum cinerariifolium TaxID=118510 RepID=A0A6L2LGK0_TANCI|nr:transmembrane 9 superfamily member 7-like [Tanacetum cinerariifolium]
MFLDETFFSAVFNITYTSLRVLSQHFVGILDNLSVAVLRQRRDESQSTIYKHGFHIGFKGNYAGSKEHKYFINNHLSFRVMYRKDLETDSIRIVGFEVTPNSHEYKEWDEKNPQWTTCKQNTKNIIQGSIVPQEVDTNKEVRVTEGLDSLVSGDLDFVLRKDRAKCYRSQSGK